MATWRKLTAPIDPPENSAIPTISGTAQVGQTLTGSPGTWSGSPEYAYQWLSDGAEIEGATDQTFVLTGDVGGTDVSLQVSGSNDGGTNYEFSAAVAVPEAEVFSGILDDLATPTRLALSMHRRVTGDYAGPLIRVRRQSDDTEQDIGFDEDGLLDTTALLAFAGVLDAYVVRVYDQSGNGRDAIQNTTTDQPTIVFLGTLVTINGSASASFNGTDDYLATAADADDIIGTNEYTLFATARPTAGGTQLDAQAYDARAIAGGRPNGIWAFGGINTTTPKAQFYHYDGGHKTAVVNSAALPYEAVFTQYRVNGTGQVHGHLNGGAGGSVAAGARTASAGNKFAVGRHYTGGLNSKFFQGEIQELFAFETLLSTADMNTLGADMATQIGVSWTNIT